MTRTQNLSKRLQGPLEVGCLKACEDRGADFKAKALLLMTGEALKEAAAERSKSAPNGTSASTTAGSAPSRGGA